MAMCRRERIETAYYKRESTLYAAPIQAGAGHIQVGSTRAAVDQRLSDVFRKRQRAHFSGPVSLEPTGIDTVHTVVNWAAALH
jgi:hypothetical protein